MLALILLFVLTTSISAAPASLCPASCWCTSSGVYLNARCNSLSFLKKSLVYEQMKLLTSLDLHDASLMKIDANLDIFSNLKRLNLSGNKIQHIAASSLPKSLEVLDASRNSIKYLPHDIHLLPNLKKVDFSGNPIFCDCDSVLIRDKLMNAGIILPHPVKCEYPKEYKGQLWQDVNCKQRSVSLFDGMVGDAPYEGSGSEDVSDKPNESIENDYIRTLETSSEPDEQEEGSGDDDLLTSTPISNEDDATAPDEYEETTEVNEPVILSVGKAELGTGVERVCYFNCSTPSPIESNSTDDLPAPGIFEGGKIIAKDLGIIDETSTGVPSTSSPQPIDSPKPEVTSRNDTVKMDAEIMDTNLNSDEELSDMIAEKESHSSFIFLAVFLLAIICLVVYVVVKKRSAARNVSTTSQNADLKEDNMEEVELLTKPVSDSEKSNGASEALPLINGHKNNEEDGGKTANVKEPEPKKDDDVQLRKHLEDRNTVTPEAKRVTIKAGEIPNSTPKTPVLVIRHMNSDGNIVTTPEVDQRV